MDTTQHEIKITRDEAGRVVTFIDGKVNSRGQGTDSAARRNAEFLARSYRISGKDVAIVDELDADPQPVAPAPGIVRLTGFRYSDKGTYSADASDLQLPPGGWPTRFITTVEQPAAKQYVAQHPSIQRDREGDITHVVYSAMGARFIIWND